MEFDNSFEVPLPPAQAWKLLLDVERIAPCMPGAELTEVVSKNTYKGKIGVRLGPVALTFAGVVKLEDIDDSAYTARVAAQGTNLTVFIHMKGEGVEWHLFGVDDCALTHEDIPVRFRNSAVLSNGVFQATVTGRIGLTNVVERSVTLTNWLLHTNIMNSNGVVTFQDSATNAARFYRARQ